MWSKYKFYIAAAFTFILLSGVVLYAYKSKKKKNENEELADSGSAEETTKTFNMRKAMKLAERSN